MYIFGIYTLVTIFNILPQLLCAPYILDDDDEDSVDAELRRHKNRRKPCLKSGEGRTFFPVELSYINVNYNYNCGGDNQHDGLQDGIIGAGNKPTHHKPFGHKPHHHHGGNRPGKPTQQNKPSDAEHDPVDDQGSMSSGHQQKPNRPFQTFVQNHSQGMGIFNALFDGIFSTTTAEKPSSTVIPVHEIQEDSLLGSPKWQPGQYITGYNPFTGQHTQDVSQFNTKQLYRRVNRGFDRFVSSITDFF